MRRPARFAYADIKRIGDSVAAAAQINAALEQLASAVASAFDAPTCVFQRTARGWILASQSGGGLRLPVAELSLVVDALPRADPLAAVDLAAFGLGAWTALALETPDAWWLLLLQGEWTSVGGAAELAAVLSLALQAVRERELRSRSERALTEAYAINRCVSRARTIESVCEKLVQRVAGSLNADRVSVAVRRPEDGRIAVVAAYGEHTSSILGASAEPGAWVMGHVFSSRRPVLVTDSAQVPPRPNVSAMYRTASFASVPVVAGAETVGVLNATDKHDGSAFTAYDLRALRLFGAAAALGIKSAITGSEMHRLELIASIDALTGLFNRPYLDARLHQEIERAKRNSTSLMLLLADIDDFTAVNDRYGHQTGDAVLQAVGVTLRSAVRVFDVCARYGGDEFAILMPTSDQSSAVALAERIRQSVADSGAGTDTVGRLPGVTISIGVSLFDPSAPSDQFVHRADESLHHAKSAGKNRVHYTPGRTNVFRLPNTGSG